jgi:hypothetical protein
MDIAAAKNHLLAVIDTAFNRSPPHIDAVDAELERVADELDDPSFEEPLREFVSEELKRQWGDLKTMPGDDL